MPGHRVFTLDPGRSTDRQRTSGSQPDGSIAANFTERRARFRVYRTADAQHRILQTTYTPGRLD